MKNKSEWFNGQCETNRCTGISVTMDDSLDMFQCWMCSSGGKWTKDMLYFLDIPGSITNQLIATSSERR